MVMPILDVKNVCVTFKSKKQDVKALDKISLKVKEGEFVGILGPSGCGKSTLLRVIGGLIEPTSGIVKTENFDFKNTSFVFQDPNLLPWRKVIDNVVLPLEIKENKSGKEFYFKARKLLRLVGLSKFENSYPYELSGGMRQRVSIARALISNPKLLLMDEPFGALDEMTRTELHVELNKIWRKTKKTIIFVTHTISEAVFLSQRVIVLTQGPGFVKGELKIDLPEVRDRKILEDKKFLKYVSEARKILYE